MLVRPRRDVLESRKSSMNSIAEKIYRLIRERSLGTDLTSLKQRGVKRVSVFKSNQLGSLVALAVEQVLREYGVKLSQGDLDNLSEEGRRAFISLLKERDSYKELCENFEKQQEKLEMHRDVLKGQIEREDTMLETERGFWEEMPVGTGSEAYRVRLEEVLDRNLESRIEMLGASPDARLVKFLEEMVEGLHRELDTLFSAAVDEMRSEYAAEGEKRIETLERRVQKMRESLDRAEDALMRAQAAGPTEDGIASIYKTVQGLTPDDEAFSQKKGMLEEIFQLNKNIKDQIG